MSLFEGSVTDYIERCMQASRSATKVFFHIPKTGGSSIRLALQEELPNFLNIKKYSELTQWDAHIAQQQKQPYDMISGHLRVGELRALYNSGADITAVTFIRDPVQRLLSQYRFMLSPKYPSHADFKAKFPTMKVFVEEAIPANPMLQTMVGECASLDQAIKSVSRDFMFVGLTEYSTIHSFMAQRCFGLPTFHIPGRANRTVNTADNKIELEDGLLDLIQEKCALDIEFYRFLEKRHMSIVDETFAAFNAALAGPVTKLPFWQPDDAAANSVPQAQAGAPRKAGAARNKSG